jgi:hypothetical protein
MLVEALARPGGRVESFAGMDGPDHGPQARPCWHS